MLCEKCNKEHQGIYGSGRFCSNICARSFSTSQNRTQINQKVSFKLTNRPNPKISQILKGKKRPKVSEKLKNFHAEKFKQQIENVPFIDLYKTHKRKLILQEQKFQCAICSTGMIWNGKPLKLELDHIDGNRQNETRENLRMICPNCHQQTPTYKNKNRQLSKITDQDIINALKNNVSGYTTLLFLGMNTHGGNYRRLRKIIEQYKLDLDYEV